MSKTSNLHHSGGWYECVITVIEDATFEAVLAGHFEDGKDSHSDPLMGGLI